MDEMSAAAVVKAIREGELAGTVQDFGRVVGDDRGQDAFMDIRLPNGQTFRIKVEETW